MKVQGSKVIVISDDSTHNIHIHVTYQMKDHFKSYTLVGVSLREDTPGPRYDPFSATSSAQRTQK